MGFEVFPDMFLEAFLEVFLETFLEAFFVFSFISSNTILSALYLNTKIRPQRIWGRIVSFRG